MDDEECWAFIESSAQLSIITVSFIEKLGVPIHQLTQLLTVERIGKEMFPKWDMLKFNSEFQRPSRKMLLCLL